MMKQRSLMNAQWTQNEIDSILRQMKDKRPLEEIARKHNRSVTNIQSRLKTIAADMYMKYNMAFDEIHSLTGVEKGSLIISSSSFKRSYVEPDLEMGLDTEDHISIPVEEIPTCKPSVIVSESPFTMNSICDHISTPILDTFANCSTVVKGFIGLDNT